jgi:hypothetical protein
MIYVPVTPPPPPSPEAQELSGHLVDVIKAYQADHPHMSPLEVRQAVRLAQTAVPGGDKSTIKVVLLGLVVMLGLGLLAYRSTVTPGSASPQGIPWVMIAVVVLLIVVGGVALSRR